MLIAVRFNNFGIEMFIAFCLSIQIEKMMINEPIETLYKAYN